MDNTLQHYGVLGMKWGVRRNKASISKTKKTNRDKETSRLSDAELQKRINRLRLEKQYKQLTNELNPSSISKGKRVAEQAIKAIGATAVATTSAITLYNNAGTIKKILKKK